MPSVRLGVGLLAGLAAGGAVVLLSYCVYLDWRRHRDPAFRRRLQDIMGSSKEGRTTRIFFSRGADGKTLFN
uniref:Translocase of outer mitochondrial membrane 20-like n=1 Tax=Mus musculus TaxID=10090 RepID=A0A1Y7VJW4_MOUSE